MKLRHRTLALSMALLGSVASTGALACNVDSYIGSVCTVGFNFCPRGTAEANGQLIAIAQNTALFSLLGTFYGGDGRTTFALPDLRGRVPVGVGQGPGLSPVDQGQQGGSESVTLSQAQMPAHTHAATLKGTSAAATSDTPVGNVDAKLARTNQYAAGPATENMNSSAIAVAAAGGSQPVPIQPPYLGLRYCIVTEGVFPSRN